MQAPRVPWLLLALALAGCLAPAGAPRSYWTRPGADRVQVVEDVTACHRLARGLEEPAAASPGPQTARPALDLAPPPRLWTRAPEQAGFARFDEQLRFERCMYGRGYQAARPR